jgi:hypothetical protein
MATSGHFIDHHANAPNVAGEGIILLVHSLWRHIRQGAYKGIAHIQSGFKFLTDPEVGQFGFSKLRANEDIVWLHISMELLPDIMEISKSFEGLRMRNRRYLGDKARNDEFRHERHQSGKGLLHNFDHCVQTPTVHVLEYKGDTSLVVESSVKSDLFSNLTRLVLPGMDFHPC